MKGFVSIFFGCPLAPPKSPVLDFGRIENGLAAIAWDENLFSFSTKGFGLQLNMKVGSNFFSF